MPHIFNYPIPPVDHKTGALRLQAQLPSHQGSRTKHDSPTNTTAKKEQKIYHLPKGEYASLKTTEFSFGNSGLRAEFLCAANKEEISQMKGSGQKIPPNQGIFQGYFGVIPVVESPNLGNEIMVDEQKMRSFNSMQSSREYTKSPRSTVGSNASKRNKLSNNRVCVVITDKPLESQATDSYNSGLARKADGPSKKAPSINTSGIDEVSQAQLLDGEKDLLRINTYDLDMARQKSKDLGTQHSLVLSTPQ